MAPPDASKPKSLPTPSETMRAMRPHLFSDSQTETSSRLPRALFEYHLETLTSRKQEYEFEHFCRKLAEKEICPNLRTQTGPTGGGDSKVDTETYPVADEISERWWIGEPNAGSERWAFAFSAKKEWKDKAKGDVEKIVATGRSYSRIYFFTNQFAADKARAEIEDELAKAKGVSIHIMDRAWIVDKVLSNDHIDLAISTLSMEGLGGEKQRRFGPRDTARQAELEELDKQVADPSRYVGVRFQLIEDCLHSALLARGLERPRNEVEARLDHAARLAKESGPRQQQMRIAYNRAWTTFWWYDDYAAFGNFYDEVEALVQGTELAADSERLLNLWQLLHTPVATGRMAAADAKVEVRRATLEAVLAPLAGNSARPTNAIHARSQQVMIEISSALHAADDQRLDKCWLALSQIVDDSKALPAYPIEPLSDILDTLGKIVDSPAFDALFEKTVDVIRARRSEGEAGEAYRRRGAQKLEMEKPYEAIRWFGRAEELLLKEEYSDELILTLAGSSLAYEQVGLLWAARHKILLAAERSATDFIENGTIGLPLVRSANRLVWLELRLGRIPHVLATMNLANAAAMHLKFTEEVRDAYAKEFQLQEYGLMIHIARLSLPQLAAMPQLPDVFERNHLTNARLALLFALGHDQAIKDEYFPDREMDDLGSLFSTLLTQPMARDITSQPVLVAGSTTVLRSQIMGAELAIKVADNPTSFGIAESLLGGIEALLATSRPGDVVPQREVTTIDIAPNSNHVGTPTVRFDSETDKFVVSHLADFVFQTGLEAAAFRHWLTDTIVEVATKAFWATDLDAWMAEILKEERALYRAVVLADALTLNRNLFGPGEKFLLTDWVKPEDKSYAPLRAEHWHQGPASPTEEKHRSAPKPGSGPPPEGMLDWSKVKHTDHRLLSPIDMELWNRAGWQAVIFGTSDPSAPTAAKTPPILGLAFQNEEPAARIFSAWRERWGTHDDADALRVAIIRGVSAANPAHYAVTIGPNLDQLDDSGAKYFLLISRIKRMEPTTTQNLDRFLAEYSTIGAYALMPATVGPPPRFLTNFYLAKRQLVIRDAWQISENDTDAMVLQEDDPPLIPPDVQNAPVTKALEFIRVMRAKRKSP